MELLLKDGMIANAYSVMKADVWIRNGKVYKMADCIEPKHDVEVFDAKNYVILPGFINDGDDTAAEKTDLEEFMQRMKEWVKRGLTTYIVNIEIKSNDSISKQIAGGIAKYFNSPLDFAAKVQIPFHLIDFKMIRQLKKMGIYHIEIIIEDYKDIFKIKWAEISTYLRYGEMFVTVIRKNEGERENVAAGWEDITESFLWIVSLHGLKAYLNIHTKNQLSIYCRRKDLFSFSSGSEVYACLDPSLFPLWVTLWKKSADSSCQVWVKGGKKAFDVHQYPISEKVKATSTNLAKLYGMYPEKGSFTMGSDADFIFVNKDLLLTYEGRGVNLEEDDIIFAEKTMVKGQWIYRDSAFSLDVGRGRHLVRNSNVNYALR